MMLKRILGFWTALLLLTSALAAKEISPSRQSHLKISTGLDYFNHLTTNHFKTTFGDIGINVGIQFDIKKRHSLQFIGSFSFNVGEPFLDKKNLTEGTGNAVRNYTVESSFDFINTLDLMLGYGIIMRLFQGFYIRPSVFIGYSHTNFSTRHGAWDTTLGSTHVVYPRSGQAAQAKHSFLTPQAILLTDFFINNYNKRFSYYASLGYKLMLNFLEDSWTYNNIGGTYNSFLISGFIIRFSFAYSII